MYAGFTNDTIFEQKLQRFWMTGLDIVLVVLQYELDLAVAERTSPNVRDDAVRNRNLVPLDNDYRA